MFLVSRTSSSDSSLFPEDLPSEPGGSHSTVKPTRPSRRFRSRLSGSTSQNGQSPDLGRGKPGEPSQPKLVEMLKGVSEVLEENTRLKKKRLEREVRRSKVKARTSAKPYDVVSGERNPSTSVKATRSVSGMPGKETIKPLDPEPMSVDAPRKSKQSTVSKAKGKEVAKMSSEDSMDVDRSVALVDVSMSEDALPKGVELRSKPSSSDPQSSAKMMPPPPVPSRALKQPPKQKPPSKPARKPSSPKPPSQSPSTPPSLTQSNSTRRRVLGMTRTTTQNSAVSPSVLPTKQKPFKSPLIKQEPGLSQPSGPSRSQARAYPIPPSSTPSQPIYPSQKTAPIKSPTPKPKKPKKSDPPPEVIDITDDPDTSYEFPTSPIDGEEFNRVMAEYDSLVA